MTAAINEERLSGTTCNSQRWKRKTPPVTYRRGSFGQASRSARDLFRDFGEHLVRDRKGDLLAVGVVRQVRLVAAEHGSVHACETQFEVRGDVPLARRIVAAKQRLVARLVDL